MSAGDLRAVIDRLAAIARGCEFEFVSDNKTQQHSVIDNPSVDEVLSALALIDSGC